jgi:3-oxoacyl-[acyl-carrier protein] reductase
MRLKGKTVLLTGASRGIGAAMAELFAAEGAQLVISGRTAGVLELAAKIRDLGFACEAVQGDVTDDSHARKLIQTCRAKFGGLNGVVNNAGVLISGKLGMLRLSDAQHMFAVNVFSAINITQYAVRAFPRGEGGSVVNIASIAGTQGIDGISAYCASKAAIIGLTKAAAKELAALNIRVNAIAPGFIDTAMARQVSPEWFQKRIEGIRMGRIGQPIEIARAAAFLLSDDSSYVTGQILGVDGGMAV